MKLNHLFKKEYRIPKSELLERAHKSFSPTEKLLFRIFVVLLVLSSASIVYKVNALFLKEIPAQGGELREGVIGSPRFVNPLLALSDADRDLDTLIYAGLLRATPVGTLIPDLAEDFKLSPDGLLYTFRIRKDATFHDGKPVTADDVLFTIQKAQDSTLKSPKRANWEGVTAAKVDEYTVTLTLKQPYPAFLENATLGILPKHLWKDADMEQFPFSPLNLEAVGSGPYRIQKIKRNTSGIPFYYELSAFDHYALGAPYLKKISVYFYTNEKELLDAFNRGEIESLSTITSQSAKQLEEKGVRVESTSLPRIFAVFFNQNQAPLLAEKAVRQALLLATDKAVLVDRVLYGYGLPIHGPIPPIASDHASEAEATSTATRLLTANTLLDKAKWVRNKETGIRERAKGKETQKLSFSLITSDVPELRESSELLKEMWGQLGIEVRLQIFESGDLNQNVIRPRKFDALLFGEIIGRDLDLFAFWHSSQRNDPGLNVAMYTNAKVDKLLEEARRTTDETKRMDNYKTAVETISADLPAIFLYSPEFIYVLPEKIKGNVKGRITVPNEQFLDVYRWYTDTEKVWTIFTN